MQLKGSEIRVTDNDTKQDITSETLRSIIAEMSGNEDKLVEFIRGW